MSQQQRRLMDALRPKFPTLRKVRAELRRCVVQLQDCDPVRGNAREIELRIQALEALQERLMQLELFAADLSAAA
jgi:hypothetical protein